MFAASYLNKQIKSFIASLVWMGLFTLVACRGNPPSFSKLTSQIIQITVTPESFQSRPAQHISTPVTSSASEGPTNLSAQATLTDIIQTILAEPEKQVGKEVVVIGFYRGWNLLGEASGRSPVTRSDWVIKDKSGSIYVQAGKKIDTNLSPGSEKDTNKLVRIRGFVRLTAEGQPYIEPKIVEIQDR